jgi:hypothetical protein
VNLDLFLFTAILLSRSLYTKYIGYSKFFGAASAWFSLRKKPTPSEVRKASCKEVFDKFFLLNFGFAIVLLVGIFVGWRLFTANTFHNFICLFYP